MTPEQIDKLREMQEEALRKEEIMKCIHNQKATDEDLKQTIARLEAKNKYLQSRLDDRSYFRQEFMSVLEELSQYWNAAGSIDLDKFYILRKAYEYLGETGYAAGSHYSNWISDVFSCTIVKIEAVINQKTGLKEVLLYDGINHIRVEDFFVGPNARQEAIKKLRGL